MDSKQLSDLRRVINENLRVQRSGAKPVPYIDVANVLGDFAARQNHVIFGRRGCGKTLLLHHASGRLPPKVKPIYLNCEDFKKHTFPNVLIEILDALFEEIEKNLTGWFGRKKTSRELIRQIRAELDKLRSKEDHQQRDIVESEATETRDESGASLGVEVKGAKLGVDSGFAQTGKRELEMRYKRNENKIAELDAWLPKLKRQIREFFELSGAVEAIYLEVDDFYHLARSDQPFVIDYIHRLCKDVPLYFKVATLRHVSTLYSDRQGQPIGAQERHDFQPINIDYSFTDFRRTVDQNRKIFREFGRLAGISADDIDGLFKGQGFERLIVAGGGVPRDCLSLFLEVLEAVQAPSSDGRIGKDDIRILSRTNFEHRIEELKQDSEGDEQDVLIKGIYVLRQFCIEKKTNVILVSEAELQQNDNIRGLLYRLLDYRIIHNAGSAMTHKSQSGTYHAFVIDIGCYAHMRVLQSKFNEIDLSDTNAKEKMRSGQILDKVIYDALWKAAPANTEAALRVQEE